MVFDTDQIVKRAKASKTNIPGACQLWTRTIIGVPSVGDFDGDGSADAEDGWKSEPFRYRHPGDRNPPGGYPASWAGGSHDNGHRAVTLPGGMIRCTDAGGLGIVKTVPLSWVEDNWGLTYLGWSESMDGVLIPKPPPPTRGTRVDVAVHKLKYAHAKPGTVRRQLIDRARALLLKIKQH